MKQNPDARACGVTEVPYPASSSLVAFMSMRLRSDSAEADNTAHSNEMLATKNAEGCRFIFSPCQYKVEGLACEGSKWN